MGSGLGQVGLFLVKSAVGFSGSHGSMSEIESGVGLKSSVFKALGVQCPWLAPGRRDSRDEGAVFGGSSHGMP